MSRQEPEHNANVYIPHWMAVLGFFDWRTRGLSFSNPWKYWFFRLWYLPAELIRDYNLRDCENYTPDWNGGTGTKVRPFLGRVLIVSEGAEKTFAWWKHLEKYKVDPRMVAIEVQNRTHSYATGQAAELAELAKQNASSNI